MTVIGPFDTDDWYTMGQLKLDLAHIRKNLKNKPKYAILEKETISDLKRYLSREAA